MEMVNMGATPEDIQDGITWMSENSAVKVVRYASQLIGPTRTAVQRRLQGSNNGHRSKQRDPIPTEEY